MYGRLAIGLTMVIAASTCQTTRGMEDTTGDTVAGQPTESGEAAGESAPAAPRAAEPFTLRASPIAPGRGIRFPAGSLGLQGRSLFQLPAGEFTLRLSQQWDLRDPLRQRPGSLLDSLRAAPPLSLEYPLSKRATVGLGVRSTPMEPSVGGVYLRFDLGAGMSLSAGIETPAERLNGRGRSTFGSSFSIEF